MAEKCQCPVITKQVQVVDHTRECSDEQNAKNIALGAWPDCASGVHDDCPDRWGDLIDGCGCSCHREDAEYDEEESDSP